MGPQLKGCGRRIEAFGRNYDEGLQWGRSLRAAEGWFTGGGGRAPQYASMGPQLKGCGRACQGCADQPSVAASMGPQLKGCGRPA